MPEVTPAEIEAERIAMEGYAADPTASNTLRLLYKKRAELLAAVAKRLTVAEDSLPGA